MDAYEIIEAIRSAKKKTPVKAYIKASKPLSFENCHVFTGTDMVVIGALMLLVPGLLFTNAMRDIIYGDTNSGINRIVQVLLIAVAIALGVAAAWNIANLLWGIPLSQAPISYDIGLQCIASFIACIGFGIIYNIYGGF